MRRRAFLVSSTAALPLLVGCTGRQAPQNNGTQGGTPQNGGGGDGGSKPTSATIELKQGAFEPKKAELAVGGTVTWKNTTDKAHRITSYRYQTDAKDWQFPQSPLESGATTEHTFEKKGLYQYYSITSGGRYSMCGAISVGDAPEIASLC